MLRGAPVRGAPRSAIVAAGALTLPAAAAAAAAEATAAASAEQVGRCKVRILVVALQFLLRGT